MSVPQPEINLAKERSVESDTMTGAGIDKTELYGEFLVGELDKRNKSIWRDNLYRKAAHKSLDIADIDGEEMGDIHANKITNGLGLRELITIGAMALGGGAIWQAPAIIDALKGDSEKEQAISPEDYVTEFRWEASVNGDQQEPGTTEGR